MPELPEVETIVREMQAEGLVGLTIERATIFWDRSINYPSSSEFSQKIARQIIKAISRRGKWIVFSLSIDTLVVHLRMTGKFLINRENSKGSHERVRLYLSDGRILHYEDQRKFGRWHLSHDACSLFENIGLEPLSAEFTLASFTKIIQGRQRQIKPLLLDQHLIAGIGNIYADEALWEAEIHPLRKALTLTENEIISLHRAIIAVLTKGIDNVGTSLGSSKANYLSVTGRKGNNQQTLKVFRCTGKPCPRCHSKIQKIFVGQRGTHFCPHCQK